MIGPRVAAVLALVLVAGIAAWWHLNFEYVTERELVGYQGPAQRNRLLAAMRLIERMGVPVREATRVTELDALERDATLILANRRPAVTVRQVERLLAWVKAGGHLIVEAEWHTVPDPLLDALAVGRRELKARPPAGPSAIALPHAPNTLRVDFGSRQHLVDTGKSAVFTVDEGWSVLLLQFALEEGRVTVLNGMRYLDNGAIARHDHAEFAWQLVRFRPSTPEVIVAARLEQPSLLTWLIEHAWQALATGAALLALALWRVAPRFGPLEPEPLPARRRLLDHLRASGRFHWSRGGAPRLIDAARESCLRRIARAHPALAGLAPAERDRELAARSGLSAQEIALALSEAPADTQRFVAAIRTLQTLEERVTRKMAG